MIDPHTVDEPCSSTEAPATPAPNAADIALAGAIGGAVLAAARAAQAMRLYGPDHPTAAGALKDTERAFAHESLAQPVVTAIFVDRLSVGEASLETSEMLRELAGALHRVDIAAVEWIRPGDEGQVRALVNWLMAIGFSAGDTAAAAASAPPACVRPFRIAGHALHFVSQPSDGASPRAADWRMVVYSVLNGSGPPDAVLTDRIEDLSMILASSSEAESAAARSVLQEMAASGQTARQRPMGAGARVGQALTGLRPELKEALIGVAAVRYHGWLEQNIDGCDLRAVAGQLFEAEREGARPSEASLRLLQRLLGSTALDTEARARVDGLASRWGQTGADAGAAASAVQVLHDLLTSNDPEDYCPEDYASDLSTAAKESGASAASLALDWSDPAPRVSEIALALLDESVKDVDSTGPLEGLSRRLPGLLAAGRLDLIERAAASCERIARSDGDRARAAVEHLRAALSAPSMLDGLLARPGASGTNLSSLCLLLGIAPGALLKRLTDRAREASADLTSLALTARNVPPSEIREFLRAEIASASALHSGHAALLSCIDAECLLFVCGPLLESESVELRSRAYEVLDQRLDSWPSGLLVGALGESELAVAALAARRLRARPDSCGIEPLGALLEGGASGQPPEGDTLDALVGALALRGEGGVVRLTVALSGLQRSIRKRNIHACRRIVAALEAHIQLGEVRKSLTTWRRSRAYTVGMFVGENSRSRAA